MRQSLPTLSQAYLGTHDKLFPISVYCVAIHHESKALKCYRKIDLDFLKQ